MVIIDFGSIKFSRVTRGSLGGKFVIPGYVSPMRLPIPKVKLNLPIRKEALLKAHANHHSKRHMDYMRRLMFTGITFKEAHKRAIQFIGR